MYAERQAAVGRRKTWQGHDERDKALCTEGAYELFDALTDADEEDLTAAGDLVQQAFWLADEAEGYQGDDPDREAWKYHEATTRLERARQRVGLRTEPMWHRGKGWWKAYRRDNKLGVVTGLVQEHAAECGWRPAAFRATKRILDAADAHDEDDWRRVDDHLTDYYDIMLSHLQTG